MRCDFFSLVWIIVKKIIILFGLLFIAYEKVALSFVESARIYCLQ